MGVGSGKSQLEHDPPAAAALRRGRRPRASRLAGVAGEILAGAFAARVPAAPAPPRWHTRPDLRIPALTVTHSEAGVSADPIFIAPYNSPTGQAGAVIVDNRGEPIWENPLAGKVTTDFRVQRYRGSPVLTWWEGSIELGHGVGEYVIADAGYRTVRRVQAARGLHGDLHEFVITPARHRAADQLRRDQRRSQRGRRRARAARSRTRSSRRSTSPPATSCWSGTASITSRCRSPTRRSAPTGTSATSTPSTSTATATCWSPRAVRTRSTRSIAAARSSGASGGKRSDFADGRRQQLRLAAPRAPPARWDAHRLRQRRHARRRAALARA